MLTEKKTEKKKKGRVGACRKKRSTIYFGSYRVRLLSDVIFLVVCACRCVRMCVCIHAHACA